jgi:hypothetical protein
MNYMTEVFRGININVTQTKLMTKLNTSTIICPSAAISLFSTNNEF